MKKWMFVILPGIMLAVFLAFFLSHKKEMEEREAARLATVAREQKEAEAKKKADEAKAHEDAVKRDLERKAEEQKKADEKAAKQAAADKEVQDATDKALAESAKSEQESRLLEAQLESLHKQKDQLNREEFEIEQKVELARVAQRNAKLEEERTVRMLIDRADNSMMARPPQSLLPVLMPPPPKS